VEFEFFGMLETQVATNYHYRNTWFFNFQKSWYAWKQVRK